jgi:hypothetical protein
MAVARLTLFSAPAPALVVVVARYVVAVVAVVAAGSVAVVTNTVPMPVGSGSKRPESPVHRSCSFDAPDTPDSPAAPVDHTALAVQTAVCDDALHMPGTPDIPASQRSSPTARGCCNVDVVSRVISSWWP